GSDGGTSIIIRYYRVRIDDIFEQILNVTTIRARDVRTNLPADIEKRVALLARARKNRAPSNRITRGRTSRGINLPIFLDLLFFVRGCRAKCAPDLLHLRVDLRNFKVP